MLPKRLKSMCSVSCVVASLASATPAQAYFEWLDGAKGVATLAGVSAVNSATLSTFVTANLDEGYASYVEYREAAKACKEHKETGHVNLHSYPELLAFAQEGRDSERWLAYSVVNNVFNTTRPAAHTINGMSVCDFAESKVFAETMDYYADRVMLWGHVASAVFNIRTLGVVANPKVSRLELAKTLRMGASGAAVASTGVTAVYLTHELYEVWQNYRQDQDGAGYCQLYLNGTSVNPADYPYLRPHLVSATGEGYKNSSCAYAMAVYEDNTYWPAFAILGVLDAVQIGTTAMSLIAFWRLKNLKVD